MFLGVIAYGEFTPFSLDNHWTPVAAIFVLMSVSFLVVILLPLEPVTEDNARAAKRALLVGPIAAALLLLAMIAKLYVGAA